MLFNLPAFGMKEEREERRRTLTQRCEFVADLVNHNQSAVVWCHMNQEGDLLEKIIPGARQIAGRTPDDEKVELYEAFASGQLAKLIIKPKIGAWGLNWQHCAHVVTFATHSYEQYYQLIRRCWRFGQKNRVRLDVVATEVERRVLGNMRRKADKADKMFASIISEMRSATAIARNDLYTKEMELPSWVS
jgi:superfamily II DNA or RNA helicase